MAETDSAGGPGRALFRIADLLDAEGVAYMVVGALAVAMWGRPRATADIDVTLEPDTLEAIARLTARERLLIASSRRQAMRDVPDKLAALADTVRALDRVRAPHAVVGGVAVGLRSGVPRATLDTDVAVGSTVDRELLTRALTDAGLRLTGTFPTASTSDMSRASRCRSSSIGTSIRWWTGRNRSRWRACASRW